MFLNSPTCTYTRNGEQRARGPFLIVFDTDTKLPNGDTKLFACVRSVRLAQGGPWM